MPIRALLLTLLVFLGGWQAPVAAQESADAPLQIAEVQALLDGVDPEGEAATRYREAIARLERAATLRASAESFRRQAEEAPALLASIREELAQPAPTPTPEVPTDATLSQLEQEESEAVSALATARNTLNELQAEGTRRAERRAAIPDLLTAARMHLGEIDDALEAESAGVALDQSQRTLLLAERAELGGEIEALRAELASYDARRDLLPARRDRASRRAEVGEGLALAWQGIVASKRKAEAERIANEAKRVARETVEEFREYAEETQGLAALRLGTDAIPQKIGKANKQAAHAAAQFTTLRKSYLEVRQRLDASGINRATGRKLRGEWESMQDAAGVRRGLAETRRELERVEALLYDWREQRDGSDDISRVTSRLLADIGGTPTPELEAVATELATARRDVLAELENDAETYQNALVELERQQSGLFEAASSYEAFIRERILWVRSISGETGLDLGTFRTAIGEVADSEQWRSTLVNAKHHALLNIASSSVIALGLIVLFVVSRLSARRLSAITRDVGRFATDRFGLTVLALGHIALVASPAPALLWSLGRVVSGAESQTDLGLALGTALYDTAILLFVLRVTQRCVRQAGLCMTHFRWASEPMRLIARNLRWFVPVVTPAFAVHVAIDGLGSEAANSTLGRLAFTVSTGAFFVLVMRLARPRGPLVGEVLRQRPGGWLDRTRLLWYPVLFGVPLALMGLAWVGFYYTAVQLQHRLEVSVALVLALVLVNGVLMRWLFVARRRVAVDDAKRRREQAIKDAQKTHEVASDTPSESGVPALDEEKVDLPAISQQTRQLFRFAIFVGAFVGLFAIWADVLPALRVFDRVQVFPEVRVVEAPQDERIAILEGTSAPAAPVLSGDGASGAANGNGASKPLVVPGLPSPNATDVETNPREALSVTLADVGVSIIVFIATILAFRNLPGLIEIMILQRLPLDAGSRYALITVIRYLIAIIGIAIAFSAIGLTWGRVQWLAAALTFGLAFGLQEIFANFVSGLIILAERPIRIGDTVTVGSISGTVTRIRMRATTITDWDRKELIIPNKEFITGQVINWTLSDTMLRLIVPVGVGYGEDVRLAERILLRIANQTPSILPEPKPYVLFNGFGDSTLDFQVRCYIPNVEVILAVRHELHMRIIEAFREADIEIAFPQRDLHIRSSGDLGELLKAGLVGRAGDGADAPS